MQFYTIFYSYGFRCWVRYDVQGYTPSFKKDEKQKDENEPFSQVKRKKSVFAKHYHKEKKEEDEIIHLNVSGCVYSTLRSTINNSGSSMLKKLIKHKYEKDKKKKKEHLMFDENGCYFIDNRNGLLFEPILNYMQSGKLVINFDKFTLDEMKREFKFYHIAFPESQHKLPDGFRFEYVLGAYFYNVQTMKYEFTVSDFRIIGPNKRTGQVVEKIAGIEWSECMNDFDLFLQDRRKFKNMGYRVIKSTTFKCDDKEHSSWTVVEWYQKYLFYKKK